MIELLVVAASNCPLRDCGRVADRPVPVGRKWHVKVASVLFFHKSSFLLLSTLSLSLSASLSKEKDKVNQWELRGCPSHHRSLPFFFFFLILFLLLLHTICLDPSDHEQSMGQLIQYRSNSVLGLIPESEVLLQLHHLQAFQVHFSTFLYTAIF